MNRNNFRLLTAALLLAGAHQAFAADLGTDAGTTVSNTAVVNFTINGNAQTAEQNNPAATFVVDRKVDVTVVDGGNTNVTPNTTGQVLSFTVTNNTNDWMDFAVGAANGAGDDFDPTSVSVFVEDGTTPGYQSGEDTATFIDELAEDDSIEVYVVGNIPTATTEADTGAIVLTATAHLGNDGTTGGAIGALAVADTDGDDATLVENVFADAAGSTDAATDGKHSDTASYVVSSASIAVAKTMAVLEDGLGAVYPDALAIPGSTIIYCIQVSNGAGAETADDVAVSDTVPANTTYVAGTLRVANSSVTCDDDADTAGTLMTDASDSPTDEGDVTANVVHTKVTALTAGSTTTTIFQVTVD